MWSSHSARLSIIYQISIGSISYCGDYLSFEVSKSNQSGILFTAMVSMPNFQRLSQARNQIVSLVVRHKILIAVSCILAFSLTGFGILATKARNQILAQIETSKKATPYDVHNATGSGITLPTLAATPPDINVLGTSDYSVGNNGAGDTSFTPLSYPLPAALPTMLPYPTPPPFTVSSSTTLPCPGTATSTNSQVYLSSSTAQVGSTVTITIELRDCNNNLASNDNLRITQQTGDQTAKANGQSLPVTIQAQNGKASFTVTSQTAGTDTFLITDTNQNFPVTTPGYHNPSITFGNNSSGNANCTTSGGTPNSWYSDVYPASPVSAASSSTVTFAVAIRDCNKNPVSSDSIRVSLNSGDSGTQINGGASPAVFLVQNGQGSFTVTSAAAGTVALTVQDTTSSFTVTDPNNHNPSVVFSSSSAPAPTPTPDTSAPTPTPGSASTPTPVSNTPTPLPTSATTSANINHILSVYSALTQNFLEIL